MSDLDRRPVWFAAALAIGLGACTGTLVDPDDSGPGLASPASWRFSLRYR